MTAGIDPGVAASRLAIGLTCYFLLLMCGSSDVRAQGVDETQCVSDRGATSGRGFSLTPTVSLTDATTKVRTVSSDAHLLVNHFPHTRCDVDHNRFDVLLNGKYDQKQKLDAAPNITRHYTGRAQELVMLPVTPYHVSLSAQFLSDNSLALYLQQTYTFSVGRTFGTDALVTELNLGGAVAAQHFTTRNPSTRFVAPAGSAHLSWAIPSGKGTDGKPRPTPELELMMAGVVGLGDDPRILTGNAALTIPTFYPPLSLTVKAWLDHISNPPNGFLNRYFTVEFGPKIAFGMLAQ